MIDEKKLIESLRASLNTGQETFPIDLIIECIEEQPKISLDNIIKKLEDKREYYYMNDDIYSVDAVDAMDYACDVIEQETKEGYKKCH